MNNKTNKILIVSSEFPPGPGGIGNHAYHLARQLTLHGIEVLILTPQDYSTPKIITAFNQQQPFSIITLKDKKAKLVKPLYRLRTLSKAVRDFQPACIIATGARSTWVTALLTIFQHIPWLAVGHGTEFGGALNWEKRITRLCFNSSDICVFVSEFTRQAARRLGIRPGLEFVIHNAADEETFHPGQVEVKKDLASELGFATDDPILLTVGNLTRRKGQEIVIQAMPEILESHPHTRYLIAGLPTEEMMLKNLARNLGVEENVYFLGSLHKEKLSALYQACDLFVMTSQHMSDGDFEGFGISVIEAALCGKPAVVSRESGLSEAVIDGETGICVPEKDPRQTANAIIKLLNDKQLRKKMGSNALRRANEELTWRIVGEKYARLIDDFLGKPAINK